MVKIPPELSEGFLRHLRKGDVLLWENYEFENKNAKTSRFLILTDCRDDCFLTIRGTTNIEIYKKRVSFHREFLMIPASKETTFPKETVFDLNNIHRVSISNMKEIFGEGLKKLGVASDGLLSELNEMVKKSVIVRQDWIDWILAS